jgi:SNF2 family DNA or RNA helicase
VNAPGVLRRSASINRYSFIHRITKQRCAVRPDEKGGGVLADEMGMGKSLAILALLIRTLERAHEWADGHRNEERSHSRAQTYSHSTLVVVPSACKS